MNPVPGINFFPFFMVIQVIILIAIVVGYVFTIIALWRMSKAHLSLAETLKVIAENLKPKQV